MFTVETNYATLFPSTGGEWAGAAVDKSFFLPLEVHGQTSRHQSGKSKEALTNKRSLNSKQVFLWNASPRDCTHPEDVVQHTHTHAHPLSNHTHSSVVQSVCKIHFEQQGFYSFWRVTAPCKTILIPCDRSTLSRSYQRRGRNSNKPPPSC